MALTQVDQGLLGTYAQYTGFKNRIINGAMVIDQRNAGTATANTISGYTVDRWAVFQSTTGKLIAQQNAGSVTPPAGFKNYLGVTSQSAYSVSSTDYYAIVQRIEGFNMADLNWGSASASTITISFWVRSSLTGTFGGAIRNDTYNYNYPFSYTVSVANTWEQKTVTVAGPTSGTWLSTNGTGIDLWFGLGVGATYSATAGSWTTTSAISSSTGATSVVGTNGATFFITGVQLEKGSTATSFDYRPYGTELALCQRYYEKSFEIGTAPTSAGSAAGAFEFAQQVAASTQQYGPSCKYAVQKRASPTVTFYNWNAAGSQAVNVVTAGNTTSLQTRTNQSGSSSFSVQCVTPAGTSAGQLLSVMWTADIEL
jgi:hypothetical protein